MKYNKCGHACDRLLSLMLDAPICAALSVCPVIADSNCEHEATQERDFALTACFFCFVIIKKKKLLGGNDGDKVRI